MKQLISEFRKEEMKWLSRKDFESSASRDIYDIIPTLLGVGHC